MNRFNDDAKRFFLKILRNSPPTPRACKSSSGVRARLSGWRRQGKQYKCYTSLVTIICTSSNASAASFKHLSILPIEGWRRYSRQWSILEQNTSLFLCFSWISHNAVPKYAITAPVIIPYLYRSGSFLMKSFLDPEKYRHRHRIVVRVHI